MTTGDLDDPATTDAVVASLRESGARFAFVHGSRATGTATPGSDLDVAAWWGTSDRPDPWDVLLPPGVDLLVLDDAPLELVGRVAVHGRLLFDDDPPARVEWQATTRLVYFDEEWRQRWITETFIEGVVNAAQHLCASEGWGPPKDNGDAVRLVGTHGVVDEQLAHRLVGAVGFRNLLVHQYAEIDDRSVSSVGSATSRTSSARCRRGSTSTQADYSSSARIAA